MGRRNKGWSSQLTFLGRGRGCLIPVELRVGFRKLCDGEFSQDKIVGRRNSSAY